MWTDSSWVNNLSWNLLNFRGIDWYPLKWDCSHSSWSIVAYLDNFSTKLIWICCLSTSSHISEELIFTIVGYTHWQENCLVSPVESLEFFCLFRVIWIKLSILDFELCGPQRGTKSGARLKYFPFPNTDHLVGKVRNVLKILPWRFDGRRVHFWLE